MLHFTYIYVIHNRETNKKMSEEPLITTFTNMRKRLLRIAVRMFSDENDAEDALQEAFCRLWPMRDKINTTQDAEALTATTLRNMSIDKQRKQTINTVKIDEEHDGIDEDNENDERERLFRQIEEIVNVELTPLQQTILKSKEYDGETLEHIAQRLNMQPAAVRMQLSRARKRIRECYQKRNNK